MKLPELQARQVWAIVLIGYLIPAFIPLGMSPVISSATQNVYDTIQSLPPNSIVMCGGGGVFAFDLESSAGLIAALKQMSKLNVKVVFYPMWIETMQFSKYCVDSARVDEKFGGPWKYGRDYVILPYIPGNEVGLVSFLNDVKKTVSTDYAGTPISQLPLMAGLNSYKDITVWICAQWDGVTILRYVTGEYGIKVLWFAQSSAYAAFSSYMQVYPGKIYITNGALGGAQYEKLNDMKGLGHAALDSNVVFTLLFIGFLVLGNLTMLYGEKNGNKKVKI
jgi:hypothetical protein